MLTLEAKLAVFSCNFRLLELYIAVRLLQYWGGGDIV